MHGECVWFETQRRPPAGSGTALAYLEAMENALPADERGEDPTKPLCGKIFVHMAPGSKLEYSVNENVRVQTVKATLAEDIGVPLCMLKLVTGRQDLDRFEFLWDSKMFVFHNHHCHIMIGPWAPGATLKL